MATLLWHPDPRSPAGAIAVQSDNPAALAAVPDAIVQTLQLTTDSVSVWALHPSEQTGIANAAYQHERSELGSAASVAVRELARPHQRNVVWIDRYHLLARSTDPAVVSRLTGLYVGTQGHLVAYVHDASVNSTFDRIVDNLPNTSWHGWDEPNQIAQCRFAVLYNPAASNAIFVAPAHSFRPQVDTALRQLANVVAHW